MTETATAAATCLPVESRLSGKLTITTPNDRDIVMTRRFDAPPRMVFDAHTRPELLKRWMGVFNGWWLDVCQVDLRPGGAFRYEWRGPKGEAMGVGGIFRDVVEPSRIVHTERFDQAWYEGEMVVTTLFQEDGGKTLLTMTLSLGSKEIRDGVLKSGMEYGMDAGYLTLDVVFAGPA